VNVVKLIHLNLKPDEEVGEPIVNCGIERPVGVVSNPLEVECIIPFAHDTTHPINEHPAVLAIKLVLGEVVLSFLDFWVVTASREDCRVRPAGHSPGTPGLGTELQSSLVAPVQQGSIRCYLRHPRRQGPTPLI